jgi:pyrrolidone-carboxylate peptidase
MKILFFHGWQSVPGGVEPTFLAQHGHEVINPKLPVEDFAKAVRIAQAEFDKHQPDVVAGFGPYVRGSSLALQRVATGGSARITSGSPKPVRR